MVGHPQPRERLKEWGGLLFGWLAASGVGAAIVAYAGSSRAADVELIKMAVDVLRTAPSDSTRALRAWSVEVINEFSAVKLSEAARAALVDSIRLPPGSISSSGMFVAGNVPGTYKITACVAGGSCDTATATVIDTSAGRP